MRSSITITILTKAVFLFLLTTGTLYSQNYKMQSSSEIIIEGTSNIHDWEMTADSKQGGAVIESENGELTAIKSLKVTVVAESLKSGKGGMDKNTYKALKTDAHKNIEFTLGEVKKMENNANNICMIDATGTLKIAGVSKQIPITFTAKINGNNLEITGEKLINMTNFNVDPPTAMMGTIKTGEEITIKFKTTFTK